MSIKNFLKMAIPSYRVGQSMLMSCKTLSSKVTEISKKIDEMDSKNEYLFWLLQRLSDETDAETKKRVFLDMPRATGKLRSMQLAENFLLQRVKKHADDLNIKLFLMWGTALGAVRHKGFIPWDDDIDIGMLRNDCQLLKEKIDKEDDLISVNRYYQANGGSIVKAKFKFSDNFFIDIFNFDLISIDESKIDSYWQRSQQYAKNYSQSVLGKVSELQLLEKAYKAPVYSKELEKYANDLYQKIECKLKTDEKSDQTFIAESILDGYFFREEEYYWRYEDVFPLLENEVEFEGQIYSVANQYLKRLKACYGDIWRLPQSISSLHSNEFNESLDDDIKRLLEMKII